MGYSTDFFGSFDIRPPLAAAQVAEIEAFSHERHDGSSFDENNRAGERVTLPVLKGVSTWGSGVWCQWVASEDGAELLWDGNEKFYDYLPWLVFLIDRFFKPWGVTVSGEVRWQGQDGEDAGVIRVTENRVAIAALVQVEESFTPIEVGV